MSGGEGEMVSPDPGRETTDGFNAMPESEARQQLSACCDSATWVDTILAGRPYADLPTLIETADGAARRLSAAEVEHAVRTHPRIGQQAEGQSMQSAWSRSEQSGVDDDEETRQELVLANREYERRFDRVFLICAAGLSAEQILTALRARLDNDTATEQAVVADEFRKIALRRLRRVVAV
ncbi:MAG: 2-oxo-4-hydroxy-4-carboxy-5-ureidoimidazoline decarboxylase [Nocardioidaceae bacterium]